MKMETGQAEWTWPLYLTSCCVVILFPDYLSWSGNDEAFANSEFYFCFPLFKV